MKTEIVIAPGAEKTIQDQIARFLIDRLHAHRTQQELRLEMAQIGDHFTLKVKPQFTGEARPMKVTRPA